MMLFIRFFLLSALQVCCFASTVLSDSFSETKDYSQGLKDLTSVADDVLNSGGSEDSRLLGEKLSDNGKSISNSSIDVGSGLVDSYAGKLGEDEVLRLVHKHLEKLESKLLRLKENNSLEWDESILRQAVTEAEQGLAYLKNLDFQSLAQAIRQKAVKLAQSLENIKTTVLLIIKNKKMNSLKITHKLFERYNSSLVKLEEMVSTLETSLDRLKSGKVPDLNDKNFLKIKSELVKLLITVRNNKHTPVYLKNKMKQLEENMRSLESMVLSVSQYNTTIANILKSIQDIETDLNSIELHKTSKTNPLQLLSTIEKKLNKLAENIKGIDNIPPELKDQISRLESRIWKIESVTVLEKLNEYEIVLLNLEDFVKGFKNKQMSKEDKIILENLKEKSFEISNKLKTIQLKSPEDKTKFNTLEQRLSDIIDISLQSLNNDNTVHGNQNVQEEILISENSVRKTIIPKFIKDIEHDLNSFEVQSSLTKNASPLLSIIQNKFNKLAEELRGNEGVPSELEKQISTLDKRIEKIENIAFLVNLNEYERVILSLEDFVEDSKDGPMSEEDESIFKQLKEKALTISRELKTIQSKYPEDKSRFNKLEQRRIDIANITFASFNYDNTVNLFMKKLNEYEGVLITLEDFVKGFKNTTLSKVDKINLEKLKGKAFEISNELRTVQPTNRKDKTRFNTLEQRLIKLINVSLPSSNEDDSVQNNLSVQKKILIPENNVGSTNIPEFIEDIENDLKGFELHSSSNINVPQLLSFVKNKFNKLAEELREVSDLPSELKKQISILKSKIEIIENTEYLDRLIDFETVIRDLENCLENLKDKSVVSKEDKIFVEELKEKALEISKELKTIQSKYPEDKSRFDKLEQRFIEVVKISLQTLNYDESTRTYNKLNNDLWNLKIEMDLNFNNLTAQTNLMGKLNAISKLLKELSLKNKSYPALLQQIEMLEKEAQYLKMQLELRIDSLHGSADKNFDPTVPFLYTKNNISILVSNLHNLKNKVDREQDANNLVDILIELLQMSIELKKRDAKMQYPSDFFLFDQIKSLNEFRKNLTKTAEVKIKFISARGQKLSPELCEKWINKLEEKIHTVLSNGQPNNIAEVHQQIVEMSVSLMHFEETVKELLTFERFRGRIERLKQAIKQHEDKLLVEPTNHSQILSQDIYFISNYVDQVQSFLNNLQTITSFQQDPLHYKQFDYIIENILKSLKKLGAKTGLPISLMDKIKLLTQYINYLRLKSPLFINKEMYEENFEKEPLIEQVTPNSVYKHLSTADANFHITNLIKDFNILQSRFQNAEGSQNLIQKKYHGYLLLTKLYELKLNSLQPNAKENVERLEQEIKKFINLIETKLSEENHADIQHYLKTIDMLKTDIKNTIKRLGLHLDYHSLMNIYTECTLILNKLIKLKRNSNVPSSLSEKLDKLHAKLSQVFLIVDDKIKTVHPESVHESTATPYTDGKINVHTNLNMLFKELKFLEEQFRTNHELPSLQDILLKSEEILYNLIQIKKEIHSSEMKSQTEQLLEKVTLFIDSIKHQIKQDTSTDHKNHIITAAQNQLANFENSLTYLIEQLKEKNTVAELNELRTKAQAMNSDLRRLERSWMKSLKVDLHLELVQLQQFQRKVLSFMLEIDSKINDIKLRAYSSGLVISQITNPQNKHTLQNKIIAFESRLYQIEQSLFYNKDVNALVNTYNQISSLLTELYHFKSRSHVLSTGGFLTEIEALLARSLKVHSYLESLISYKHADEQFIKRTENYLDKLYTRLKLIYDQEQSDISELESNHSLKEIKTVSNILETLTVPKKLENKFKFLNMFMKQLKTKLSTKQLHRDVKTNRFSDANFKENMHIITYSLDRIKLKLLKEKNLAAKLKYLISTENILSQLDHLHTLPMPRSTLQQINALEADGLRLKKFHELAIDSEIITPMRKYAAHVLNQLNQLVLPDSMAEAKAKIEEIKQDLFNLNDEIQQHTNYTEISKIQQHLKKILANLESLKSQHLMNIIDKLMNKFENYKKYVN